MNLMIEETQRESKVEKAVDEAGLDDHIVVGQLSAKGQWQRGSTGRGSQTGS